MPRIEVRYFREADRSVPLLDWLDELPAKAQDKCLVRLARLQELGHELRRPEGDYLRDGIYELRASLHGIHYRMLYFFYGSVAVVVSHGLVKERSVPLRAVERAIERKRKFERDPRRHSFQPEL